MGSTDEPNIRDIDASVGGLVWVRRRNGSWWPGRIMGLDELSEGCLVSPRSGTPVKLLGRKDASVDWYNLEKSKRVKAFRCGEYNECIEKAKASAANSNKRAVKYARREDAILHALEIESARLGKDHPDYFSRKDNSGGDKGSLARESPTVSHSGKENDMSDEMSGSEDASDSAPELSQSGISFEEPNNINGTKGHSKMTKRRKTPNDSEDDGSERIKRMRGLEDLGMGVGSKRKAQAADALEIVQQYSSLFYESNAGSFLFNGDSINGSRNHSSSVKRKRSQVANVHEFLKRKNRRRPLTKVASFLHYQENMNVLVEPDVHDIFARIPGFGFVQTFYSQDTSDLHERVDFVACLGGDGVILHASNLFRGAVPPVVSFNLGSLGFLTSHTFEDYMEDLKQVIHVPGKIFDVLNEVVVDRGSNPYLSKVECYEHDRLITKVQGDGVIVATPTGSTAYSTAAGGSMVHPNVPCMLFTPICPHSLSFRPVILPDSAKLELKIPDDARSNAWVSFDGKRRQQLSRGHSIRISMSQHPLPTVNKSDQTGDWFHSLIRCLNWNERLDQKALEGI
ncbi:Detected protein of confused Function [Hibiscus syriacus]|uniref:NAD(+) kinase n=1 Tax=Hibiscus syriacus TaxID=106335 RepID=A0A6A3CL73_HIBSY|nr:Detected protein of confused Function [Hibiscus syriacus]